VIRPTGQLPKVTEGFTESRFAIQLQMWLPMSCGIPLMLMISEQFYFTYFSRELMVRQPV